MRRSSSRLVVAVCALVLAAPALAAYVCHPDPAGTRSVSLRGDVVAYSMLGHTLTIALRSGAGCSTFAWDAADGSLVPARQSCQSLAPRPRVDTPTRARLLVARGGDRADRLQVLAASGRSARSWPLPVRVQPGTVQVAGGLAAFLSRGGHGLWITRLADGRTTFVAPVRKGDRPLLNASGAAYQDNVYKHAPAGRTLMKFVPTRALEHELSQVARAVHTGGPIRSFSADGTRVALVVGGGANGCDRVMFWNVPWRSVAQVSQQAGPTCASLGGSRTISNVALGGGRAQWVTTHRDRPMLVAADSIGCQEWVIRRLSDSSRPLGLSAVAADGPMLAFAVVGRTNGGATSQIGRLSSSYRGLDVFSIETAARALSADGDRIAVLGADGLIRVRTDAGASIRVLPAPSATSLALRGNLLVTTTRNGRLDVYSVASGHRMHSWKLPAGAAHVDVQYVTAVVTAGRSIHIVNVKTGRTARVATTPTLPRAQIEPIGVVYAYSQGDRGTAKVIPMSRVEKAVGR